MAASRECRVSQKQQPPTGHSLFPALTWAEGTETPAVPHGTGYLSEGPGMAPCTSTSDLEHLPLLPASHLGPACPGEGLVLVCGCSRKRNGSPRVGRTHPCSSIDVPWASPHHVGLPGFIPVLPGACCQLAPAQPAGHAHLDACHTDSFHQTP